MCSLVYSGKTRGIPFWSQRSAKSQGIEEKFGQTARIFFSSHVIICFLLTLIWVGFLGVHFVVGGGGGVVKLLPCLKLVRIMLSTGNLVCKYTHI